MNLSKNLSKRILIIIFLGFFIFLGLFLFLFFKDSTHTSLIPLVVKTTIPLGQGKDNFGLPVRLKIPNINVDAVVEDVGLTSDGAMEVPKGPDNVAWFDLGPHPGDNGSAVIAGHFGWKNSIPAVFDNLYKLKNGDKIIVEDDKGATISFVVRESRKYDANADASDVFGSTDGKAHLNLVTCEGIWNSVKKGRPYRLVVFADKE